MEELNEIAARYDFGTHCIRQIAVSAFYQEIIKDVMDEVDDAYLYFDDCDDVIIRVDSTGSSLEIRRTDDGVFTTVHNREELIAAMKFYCDNKLKL